MRPQKKRNQLNHIKYFRQLYYLFLSIYISIYILLQIFGRGQQQKKNTMGGLQPESRNLIFWYSLLIYYKFQGISGFFF